MKTLNRGLIMWCMQSAIGKITPQEPRYSELMTKTLAELAAEGVIDENNEERWLCCMDKFYSV